MMMTGVKFFIAAAVATILFSVPAEAEAGLKKPVKLNVPEQVYVPCVENQSKMYGFELPNQCTLGLKKCDLVLPTMVDNIRKKIDFKIEQLYAGYDVDLSEAVPVLKNNSSGAKEVQKYELKKGQTLQNASSPFGPVCELVPESGSDTQKRGLWRADFDCDPAKTPSSAENKFKSTQTNWAYHHFCDDPEKFEFFCVYYKDMQKEMAMARGLYVKAYRNALAEVIEEIQTTKMLKIRKMDASACGPAAADINQAYLTIGEHAKEIFFNEESGAANCGADIDFNNETYCNAGLTNQDQTPEMRVCYVQAALKMIGGDEGSSFIELATLAIEGRARHWYNFYLNHDGGKFFKGMVDMEAMSCRNWAREAASGFVDDNEDKADRIVKNCWRGQSSWFDVNIKDQAACDILKDPSLSLAEKGKKLKSTKSTSGFFSFTDPSFLAKIANEVKVAPSSGGGKTKCVASFGFGRPWLGYQAMLKEVFYDGFFNPSKIKSGQPIVRTGYQNSSKGLSGGNFGGSSSKGRGNAMKYKLSQDADGILPINDPWRTFSPGPNTDDIHFHHVDTCNDPYGGLLIAADYSPTCCINGNQFNPKGSGCPNPFASAVPAIEEMDKKIGFIQATLDQARALSGKKGMAYKDKKPEGPQGPDSNFINVDPKGQAAIDGGGVIDLGESKAPDFKIAIPKGSSGDGSGGPLALQSSGSGLPSDVSFESSNDGSGGKSGGAGPVESAAAYGGGGGAYAGRGGRSIAGFSDDSGSGLGAPADGDVDFGSGAGHGPDSLGSDDRADYFSLIGVGDSLFRIVERRYRTEARGWALQRAQMIRRGAEIDGVSYERGPAGLKKKKTK